MNRLFPLAAAITFSSAWAADWPQYLGPERNGMTGEQVASNPKEVWRRNFGIGISQVVVSGDRAYTMGNEENETTVYCLDPSTGKDIWTYGFFSPTKKNNYGSGNTPFPGGPTSTPAVHEGKVYTVSRFGHVHCLDAETGKVVWELEYKNVFPEYTELTWGAAGSPFLYGGKLILEPGGKGHSCVALNPESGEVIWKAGDDEAAYSTPQVATINGKETLLTFNAFGLVGRDPSDGTERFRKGWKTKYDVNAAQPLPLDGSRVFVSSAYGSGCALFEIDGSDVETVWESKVMRNKHTVSLLMGKHLYGFDEETLRCIEAATGTPVWEKEGYGRGALTAAGGGHTVVQAENGTLAIAKLSPSGIEVVSEQKLFTEHHSWTAPSVADGTIFARDVGGNVVALK